MEGLTMELLDTQGAPQSLCDQHRSVTKHLYLTLWERQWLDAPEDNTQQASCGGQITQTIEIKKKIYWPNRNATIFKLRQKLPTQLRKNRKIKVDQAG